MKFKRRFTVASLLILMMLSVVLKGSPLLTDEKGKMDFLLVRAVNSAHNEKILSIIPGSYNKNGKFYINILLKLTDNKDDIDKNILEIRARSGDVVIAAVPVEELNRVARLPQVLRMEAGSTVMPALNLSIPDIRADEVWTDLDFGDNQGQDVLVGMVDTGISLEHEDFLKEQGSETRIQYIWDMFLGIECDQNSINQGDCDQEDKDGHGTAVMGAIAGNGRTGCGQTLPCKGVAPKAEILVVKLKEDSTSVDVAEAVEDIFSKADELGKPAVVNLSLSWFSGPRDGSSLAEQFITNQTGQGKIVVASAGNEGLTLGHAEANLTNKTTAKTAKFKGPSPRNAEIQGWYDWSDADQGKKIKVRVLCELIPGVGQLVTDWLEFGDLPQTRSAPCGGEVTLDHNGETDSARGFSVTVKSSALDIRWLVEFQGEGFSAKQDREIDLWISPLTFPDLAPRLVFLYSLHGDEYYRKTITPPCTADDVICVSSYNTRCPFGVCDKDLGFGFFATDDNIKDKLGSFSAFSSRGLRRDGAKKPELGAPGQALIVPWEPDTYLEYATGATRFSFDLLAGASLASAHMAGAVALMLQMDPTLTPNRISGGIPGTVRPWVYDETAWTHAYINAVYQEVDRGWRGYGKLDAYSMVELFILIPDPPSNLRAELLDGKKVKLTWDPSPSVDVIKYNIYGNGGSGDIDYTTPLAEVTAPTTDWTSGPFNPGETYWFGVRAVSVNGEEKNTDVKTSIGIPLIAPPRNLQAALVNSSNVRLTWDPSPTASVTAYRIYWDAGSGLMDFATPLAQVAVTAKEWTSQELPVGTYLFVVRSMDADQDESQNTIPVSATVFAKLGSGDDDFCFIASAAFSNSRAGRVDTFHQRFPAWTAFTLGSFLVIVSLSGLSFRRKTL